MIIGAWALAVWGRPRATMDLDFMVMVDEKGLAHFETHLIRGGFSVDDRWLEINPMLKMPYQLWRVLGNCWTSATSIDGRDGST